jgi:MASE9 protein
MTSQAKLYIATITTLAGTVVAAGLSRWNPGNLTRFVQFFSLAMLASGMKVRLPGFKTNISLNFVFVLVGIALFTFGETVLIGLGGALVQSLWKTQNRPKRIQVLFNAACLTVCTAAAFVAPRYVLAALGIDSLSALMALGACVYVVLNTGLVSLVISLVERRPLRELWSSCYEWTFPYFLVGTAIAGLASAASHGTAWGATLLVLPAMYFVFLYYRMHIVRAVLESVATVSQANNVAQVGAYRDR